MSLPFDGFKAAQTGLVDMGNISFYDTGATPAFSPFELAQYATSFSEIVLNVTWAQSQASQGSLDTSFIDGAIQQVNQFNDTYHTDLGIKLRVWGGFTAPTWVKEINGAPITVTGQNAVDPGSYAPQTIGRFWSADYINAWQNLQNALATKYDGMAIIRGISQTAGAYATDEPFVPLRTNAAVSSNPADGTVNQIAQLQMGGFNDGGEMLTLRAAIADYSQWSTTPLDYTMNSFHLFDSGVELNGGNFTLAVLQQARNSARIVQAGNHALRTRSIRRRRRLRPARQRRHGQAGVGQQQLPDGRADHPGGLPGLAGRRGQGVLLNAGNIELWDFPTNAGMPNGFLSFSAAEFQGLASILAAGSPPPTTGAPDDGSLLGFIAPGSITGAPGRVAFSGTNAILLASNSSATSYSVTLTSLGGGTLGIDGLGNFFGATSGTTLNFNGSLSLVNTVLAHLTDTVSSGTDVVHIVATDNNGNTIVRDVGVQTAAPVAPPTVTPGLLPANQLFNLTDGTARVVGQGQAANLDVAGQLGNSGVLVVGGVQSQLALAGNLDLSGNTSLLAALSPNAYSTASLTIGGALSVQTGSSTYFSGTLAANTINNAGGTIRGNGTLDATGSASITNTGTIEAVADFTLGSQRLVVADNLTGAGTLTIDAGATLVLNGTVDTQTVNFVANSATQLAQYPYSPSTLVLKDPGNFTGGSINGFTFADRLVLENVTLSGTPTYAGGVLTVTQAGVLPTLTFSMPDPDGHLTGLAVQVGPSPPGTPVVITFAAPAGGTAPGVFVPGGLTPGVVGTSGTLHGTAGGVRVLVPDVVLHAPLAPGVSPGAATYSVTVAANTGIVRVDGFATVDVGGGTSVTIPNVAATTATALATTLAQVEQYLQTLTYQARGTAADQITITVTDTAARSGAATIDVTNTNVAGAFEWQPAPGSTDFTDPTNWTVGTTAPGGGNVALFTAGDHTATGNGAVGQIFEFGRDHAHRQHRGPGHRRPRGRRRQWRCAHADRRRAAQRPAAGARRPHGTGLLLVSAARSRSAVRRAPTASSSASRAAAPARCSTSSRSRPAAPS